jgi:hypothetical protein
VILYVKSRFFLSHVVFNLTMEWTPRAPMIRRHVDSLHKVVGTYS